MAFNRVPSGNPTGNPSGNPSGVEMDATLLTREPIEGAVHADALAGLLQSVAGRGLTGARSGGRLGRRYALHCTETGVELVGQRDPHAAAPPPVATPAATSPRSSSANSGPRRRVDDEGFESDDSASEASSCCLVNDHVFAKTAVTPMASTSSDSANSSGASDTDEPDPSAAAAATGPLPPRENFTFQDVVFCHVDPGFPRNLVLVVRRSAAPRRNRGRDDVADVNIPTNNTGSLEALVFEFSSEENVRRLCSKYQELNRRVRLESRFRRKEVTQPHAAEPRFNLQRTDLDGVTHITVALATGLNADDAENDVDGLCGPSSIISISTPDAGNILEQSVSTSRNRTRIHKEIDGVIRADVEPSSVSTLRRQRFEKDDVTITPPSPSPTPQEPAPMRPERRRFLRKLKNNPAPQPPQTNPRANSVLRGQFVRVSVDPASTPSPPPPPPPPPTWLNHFPAGWVNQPAPPRGPPEPWNRDVISYPRQHPRRSRSSDAARNHARTRSPPAPARRPMAYRYVDTPPPPPPSNSLSNRFFGLSQKIREIGTSVVGNSTHISAHRRNSWGDSPSRFYTSLEPQPPTNSTTQNGHLRSIVKNNKKNVGESQCNHEPKKVTFSAFATVQVMK